MEKLSIYHILLDRFAGEIHHADQPVFAGGTLIGASQRLAYIADMGFNAVWISPFYQTVAYHGYHITDFYSIDPRFGTEEHLEKFISQAHQLRLKVFADFVPNHLSREHPYFVAAQQDADSQYRDWFHWQHWPDKYRSFLFFDEIPKINLRNKDAREHIIGAAQHWLAKGLDGLRIDHAIGVPMDFNREFYRRIKTQFPDAFIFGEVWAEGISRRMFGTINIPYKWLRWIAGTSQTRLQFDYAGCFDALLDFSVQNIFRVSASEGLSAEQTAGNVAEYFKRMPKNYTPVCFLDNHDMDRFIWQASGDTEKLKIALTALCGLSCPIAIYYGTESGMSQTESIKSGKPHADLAVRQPMHWYAIDAEMHDWLRTVLKRRAEDTVMK